MRVLVCGSRTWMDYWTIFRRLGELPAEAKIIHGAAKGADSIAESVAQFYGLKVQAYPAAWKTHGKRAGVVRNLQMLDEQPDLVIAFWDGKSRGTQHTIDEARKRGIPVEVIRP